jgi:hypothetical protein
MTYSEKVRLKQSNKVNKNMLIAFILGILIGSFMLNYYHAAPIQELSEIIKYKDNRIHRNW